MLNKWGTVAFERNFIQRILTNDPHRGVETWLRMVPPAYRADVATWVTETFNRKWAKQKATQETMHALVAEIMRFIEGVEPRDPIPDDGIPWIADPPPWEWRHEEHQRRMMDILATGPVRPGYQHSPATYVEGREAPRLDAQEPDVGPWYDDNDHGGAARRIARDCIHGAEVAEVVDPGHGLRPWWRLSQTHEHGEAATWDAAIEACCAALARTRSVQQPAAAKAPDVEACARAAFEAYMGKELSASTMWENSPFYLREPWYAAAIAVLAAGRGGK